MTIRTHQPYEIPGTWESRQLSYWQQKRRQGYHLYWCDNCQVWWSLTDGQNKDAENCCECDYCGKMIEVEIAEFSQVSEILVRT